MVSHLQAAKHRSMDPPSSINLQVTTLDRTGRPGRPRISIDQGFLQQALAIRGPYTIGPLLNCHPRTVRRRALELGLAAPGHPVYAKVQDAEGQVQTLWTSTTPPMSTLSDNDLDIEIGKILNLFPHFGRRMIIGTLHAWGHRVSADRVRESYVRVWGAPATFGDRPIIRKKYWVPGVNSLWHHDGNHGELGFDHSDFTD